MITKVRYHLRKTRKGLVPVKQHFKNINKFNNNMSDSKTFEPIKLIKHSQKTSIARNKLPTAVNNAIKLGIFDKNEPILDWGSGHASKSFLNKFNIPESLRNKGINEIILDYLNNDFEVYSYDPNFSNKKPPKETKFKQAIVSFVLNVVPQKIRKIILKELSEYLDEGATVLVAVRTTDDVKYKKGWKRFEREPNSFITGTGTFQHGFDTKGKEVTKLMESSGFKLIKNQPKIHKTALLFKKV